jgi:predicted secreted protein
MPLSNTIKKHETTAGNVPSDTFDHRQTIYWQTWHSAIIYYALYGHLHLRVYGVDELFCILKRTLANKRCSYKQGQRKPDARLSGRTLDDQ